LPDSERQDLIQFRLERAHECLSSAIRELDAGAYRTAANRSYYCIFHAMRAVLALDGFDSKKHSGVISMFRQKYLKTDLFSSEFSDMIRDAFTNRGQSDYSDFFVISKEDTSEQIENAKTFLAAVDNYINSL